MANAQAAKFQKTVVSVPTVLISLNLEDGTLKSNAASECLWTSVFLQYIRIIMKRDLNNISKCISYGFH